MLSLTSNLKSLHAPQPAAPPCHWGQADFLSVVEMLVSTRGTSSPHLPGKPLAHTALHCCAGSQQMMPPPQLPSQPLQGLSYPNSAPHVNTGSNKRPRGGQGKQHARGGSGNKWRGRPNQGQSTGQGLDFKPRKKQKRNQRRQQHQHNQRGGRQRRMAAAGPSSYHLLLAPGSAATQYGQGAVQAPLQQHVNHYASGQWYDAPQHSGAGRQVEQTPSQTPGTIPHLPGGLVSRAGELRMLCCVSAAAPLGCPASSCPPCASCRQAR